LTECAVETKEPCIALTESLNDIEKCVRCAMLSL